MATNFPQVPNIITRRSFLRKAAYTTLGATAMSNTIRDLRLISKAVAQTGLTDYKALVCVFLGGGNDANNWIIPTDTPTFDAYTNIRGNLAMPQPNILPLYVTGTTPYVDAAGHTYGFHPACPELQALFNADKLGVMFNVGTLVRPTTRAQYLSNAAFYTPPQLFSHSDQVSQWQTSVPDGPQSTGWGGRVADLLDAVANPSGTISMSVSVNGANTFEVGNLVSQYQVSSSGAVTLSGDLMSSNALRVRTMRNILGLSNTNLQRTAYAGVMDNAIAIADTLNTNIAPTASDSYWNTPFPTTGSSTTNPLGSQLKMIARLIQARSAFQMTRQVFFCSIGSGFDTHTSQVLVNGVNDPTNSAGTHYKLLAEVSACLSAFQLAMEQLGVSGKVTTFTASDFCRTLPTNSQGSDHGWGSHHIMVGGAVKGGQTYGKLPTFAINGPDDTGLGRWIPTQAVDQYSATLAKWFGVDPGSNMNAIFPNLSRFSTPDLGFMM
jgi:uncharacterized protein (DUF1501 family)